MPRQQPFCPQDTDLTLALPLLIKRLGDGIEIDRIGTDNNITFYSVDYGAEHRTWELYKTCTNK